MNNAQVHGCPLEGWACFHCGEVFTTVGGAADHFGTTPDRTPACQIKYGDELGLVMALRRAEDERDQLRRDLAKALTASKQDIHKWVQQQTAGHGMSAQQCIAQFLDWQAARLTDGAEAMGIKASEVPSHG